MKLKNLFYGIIMLLTVVVVSCTKEDNGDYFTGSIYGKVTDATTGEMISSATVTISPNGASATTGSDGTFQFLDLDPDQYTIQVQKSDYSSNSKIITVTAGQTSSGDITMAPISSTSKIELSTSVVTLTADYPSQSITINNIGNSGTASWNITELTADWLTISPTSGDTAEGKYSTIIISADFDKVSQSTSTNVIVNADGESVALMIKVSIDDSTDDSGSTTDPEQGTDDNGGSSSDDPVSGDDGVTTSTLSEGLFVYYTFEENTNDQTDTGLDAKVMGAVSYVDNTVNGTKAVKFSKIEESYLHIGNGLVDGSKVTVSFWANGLTDGNIFYANRTNGTDVAFSLSLYDGDLNYNIRSYTNYYSQYVTCFTHSSVTDSWHMITLTSTQSGYSATSELYIDGEYWSTVTLDLMSGDALAEYNDCTSFQLGGSYSSNIVSRDAIAMSIDNFRVYDTRILSASEIKELYELESK